MSEVGQKERETQRRLIRLFADSTHPFFLGYTYLGNWEEREGFLGKGNRNIEPERLGAWLKKRGRNDVLMARCSTRLRRRRARPARRRPIAKAM